MSLGHIRPYQARGRGQASSAQPRGETDSAHLEGGFEAAEWLGRAMADEFRWTTV